MTVTAATLRQQALMQVRLDRTVDAATRDIVQAWSRAWQEVAVEYEAAIQDLLSVGDGEWPTRGQVRRVERAKEVLQITAAKIEDLSSLAGVRITRDLPRLADDADEFTQAMTRTQLPPGAAVTLSRADAHAIEAMVKRTTEQVTSLLWPLSGEATAAMKSALIRGVNVGDNPRVAARDMMSRCQGVFNGGAWRAENIARTEMLDAHRSAAKESRQANTDVVKGWTWICELSSRTCSACLSMNGTEHPVSEDGPEGHGSCRCTSSPTSKSWEELGFDGIEEPASDIPDAEAWFNSQDKATQTQIMGPTRLDAYRSGDLGWDRMAVRQANPGWRHSYVPRKVG